MRRTHHHGWILLEMIWSIILLGMLAGMIAVTLHSDQLGLQRLSDSRASFPRTAESALAAMQTNQSSPATAALTLKKISSPTDLPGMTWIEVRDPASPHAAPITGLVPSSSADRWQKGLP